MKLQRVDRSQRLWSQTSSSIASTSQSLFLHSSNAKSLALPHRKLSVEVDVSCDTTNPHNPVPIYTVNTTFDKPAVPVKVERDPPLCVISIDLPSLLPREASEAFSEALLPSLLQLKHKTSSRVWPQAEQLFKEKVMTLDQTLRSGVAFVTRQSLPIATK